MSVERFGVRRVSFSASLAKRGLRNLVFECDTGMTPVVDFPVPNGVLEPGDIVHIWREPLLPQNIRVLPRVKFRLTAGVSKPDVPQLICEAGAGGVRENPLRTLDVKGLCAVIIRWPGLSDEEKQAIVQVWRKDPGNRYPVSDLALNVLDRTVFRGEYRMRRLPAWNARASTSFVLNGYREAGVPIDRMLEAAPPDKLLAYQLKQGHQIVWVNSSTSLGSLWELYGRFRSSG